MSPRQITEPMTMATDYLLVVAAVVWAGLLFRKARRRERSTRLWVTSFLVVALAALAGGTAHGFRQYMGEELHGLVWAVTRWSIALGVLLTAAAVLRSVRYPLNPSAAGRKAGNRWLIRGGLATLAGLLVQQSGWSIHEQFNYNDIYHLVQLLGLYCIYRGAVLLDHLEGPARTPARSDPGGELSPLS